MVATLTTNGQVGDMTPKSMLEVSLSCFALASYCLDHSACMPQHGVDQWGARIILTQNVSSDHQQVQSVTQYTNIVRPRLLLSQGLTLILTEVCGWTPCVVASCCC